MLNKYLAIGNLTQDPSAKTFDSGNTVCNFSIAINDLQGTPFYMDVQTWNKNAEKCLKFLQKGNRVFIEGRLKCNTWNAKNGERRSKTYCSADIVHFLSGNTERDPHNINTTPSDPTTDITDDELAQIPF